MANGLLKQFDSIRPGETIQGLIDPTWPGLVKGSGTMDPNAAWPLLGMTAARSIPAAASFVRQGTGEIVDTLKGVGNLARKFPYRIARNLLQGEETARQLKKVTDQIKGREYPHDVGVEEEDAGEFLGPGVFGEDDIDIPEDEELLDKQLRAQGFDPDSIVKRGLEKIEERNPLSDSEAIRNAENVTSLLEFKGDKEIKRRGELNLDTTAEVWATTGLMRGKLDAGEDLDGTDQRFINYILFNQMLPDDELDLRAWSREDIEERLEFSWHGTVDRLFTGLNDEDMDLLINDMGVIIDHVSTKLKENPDVDYGGEVLAFPIDAGDSEPSDEVVFGDSKVLEFKDHPDLPRKVIELPNSPFHVSVIRLPDDTYKAKALDVRSREIRDLPKEIADLFIGKFNSEDIEKAIKLLEDFFNWEG